MDKNSIKLINSIDFWKSEIKISPVGGGITNKNFLVEDNFCLLYTSPSPRD